MRRLIFTLIFSAIFSCVLGNDYKTNLGIDTLTLKTLVDSLNKQIKEYGLSREVIQVKENGEVTIKSLRFDQQFNFNFFKLGNDTLTTGDNNKESKFGIRTIICDPRTHAPRHTIEFTTPDGEIVAFLFFNCFKHVDIKLIHQLILAIRNECIEIKDYLK